MNKRVVVVAAVDIAVRLFELFLGSFVCEPVCGDGGGGGGYMYTQTMAKNYLWCVLARELWNSGSS